MKRCPRCLATMMRGTFMFHRCPGAPVLPIRPPLPNRPELDETPRERPINPLVLVPRKRIVTLTSIAMVVFWVSGLLFMLGGALSISAGELAMGITELSLGGVCMALGLAWLPWSLR